MILVLGNQKAHLVQVSRDSSMIWFKSSDLDLFFKLES